MNGYILFTLFWNKISIYLAWPSESTSFSLINKYSKQWMFLLLTVLNKSGSNTNNERSVSFEKLT